MPSDAGQERDAANVLDVLVIEAGGHPVVISEDGREGLIDRTCEQYALGHISVGELERLVEFALVGEVRHA